MTDIKLDDLNVLAEEPLISPNKLKKQVSASLDALQTVAEGRKAIKRILNRQDHRLMIIVGPCSIHDSQSAIEYAHRLKELANRVSENLLLIMRVYFEKPRTTVGWKGFLNDPNMDDSFNIAEGLALGRKLLIELAEMGLPTANEALDPVSPQYLQDLICWSAIGARTAESQTHREMASGLSSAVGFKNGTDGSLEVAINALKSVSAPHRFLGINHNGEVAIIQTRGNHHAHVVLRGGADGPNYEASKVSECEQRLDSTNIPANIMIDCSHANSAKDHKRQVAVMKNVSQQIARGNQSIIGLMVESHLNEGNQPIPRDLKDLRYGISITDACVDWQTTEQMLLELHDAVAPVLLNRSSTDSLSTQQSA